MANWMDSSDLKKVAVDLAPGTKCERCWKVLPEVGEWREFPDICMRCVDAVLMQCTGYDRHHHAIKRWDISYRTALDQGRTPSEAEAHAGEWNLRVKPFRGKFADYQEPEIT